MTRKHLRTGMVLVFVSTITILWLHYVVMPNIGIVNLGPKGPNRTVKSLNIGWAGIGAAWPYTLLSFCCGLGLAACAWHFADVRRGKRETSRENELIEWAKGVKATEDRNRQGTDELNRQFESLSNWREALSKQKKDQDKREELIEKEENRHKHLKNEHEKLKKDYNIKCKLLGDAERRILFLEKELCKRPIDGPLA